MTNIINLIDTSVYDFIMNFQSTFMDWFMIFITSFASAPVLIGFAVIILVLLKYKLPIINLALVFVINRILKLIFMRERPQNVTHFVNETWYSFPSAHVMISTAFYGYIIYLIYKKDLKYKWIYISLLSVLLLLIAVSRVYLGAHYATDVIGGVIFAIIYLAIFIAITNKIKKRKAEQ